MISGSNYPEIAKSGFQGSPKYKQPEVRMKLIFQSAFVLPVKIDICMVIPPRNSKKFQKAGRL